MKLTSKYNDSVFDGSPRTPVYTKRHSTHRACPRVTLRFSEEDYERLQEAADGMALAIYIRAQVLGDALPRRRKRGGSIKDRKAIAQLLGLLGQSRIANNLNQIAHHANIGTLVMNEVTTAQVDEAYHHIQSMRVTLMKALGLKG